MLLILIAGKLILIQNILGLLYTHLHILMVYMITHTYLVIHTTVTIHCTGINYRRGDQEISTPPRVTKYFNEIS